MRKKIIIAAISAAGVSLLGVGVWFGVRKFNQKMADVYSVQELAQQMWWQGTSLEGMISSSVSQEIHLEQKQVVDQVYVTEGQEVTQGMPLMAYDMTLVNIDLEMEKLNHEQLKIKKKGLENELVRLENAEVISAANVQSYEPVGLTSDEGEPDFENPDSDASGSEGSDSEPPAPEGPDSNPPSPEGPDMNPPAPEGPDSNPPAPENPDSDNPGGQTPERPKPSMVYERLYGDITLETQQDIVVENAVPYKGQGTAEDPLVYLCKPNVYIQGAFLNKAAGYGEESQPVHCLLEVREQDKEDGRLLAALWIHGDKITEKAEPSRWFKTSLGAYTEEIPAEEEPEEPDMEEFPEDFEFGETIPPEVIEGGYTEKEKKKAIADKKKEIKDIELDIRDSSLKIQQVEKKLQNQTVKSTLNGIVKKVGDPEKGETDGEAFIIVESTEGSFVKGTVDEFQLEQIKAGQILSGTAYESMISFEAEVRDVSTYPVSGNRYYGGGGRELSYYPFIAYIKNSEGLKNQENVSMQLPAEEQESSGIYLSREYVRNKDGQDFVFIEDENQKLKKQIVRTGKNFYGMIEIKEGITEEDHIAFPYGKQAKEGTKVKRVSMEELYSKY